MTEQLKDVIRRELEALVQKLQAQGYSEYTILAFIEMEAGIRRHRLPKA